jgi:hypothetical protein
MRYGKSFISTNCGFRISFKGKEEEDMKNNDIFQQAIEARRLTTVAQVRLFDEVLALIAADTKETEHLRVLYQLLDDQSAHHEVTWGVIHVLEAFAPEQAIDALFEALPLLRQQATEWLAILNRRWFERRDMQLLARRQLAARSSEQQVLIVQCFPVLATQS